MDFKLVLGKLIRSFDEQNVNYALIGGFAMGVWGISRATLDLDFLVIQKDLLKIEAIMNALGYEKAFQSENVSQYISPIKIFGEVDFLHAFRTISEKMLQRADQRSILNHTLEIKVLRIEDLIGLKLQALTNDPAREKMDLLDIEALISLKHEKLDWNLLSEFFSIFGFETLFSEMKEKYS
jgi:hypothetical protein